jgi:hypothetical protein
MALISGSEVPDVTPMLEDIVRLRRERDEAVAQHTAAKLALEKQSSKQSAKWTDEEFSQIRTALADIEISTKAFSTNPSSSVGSEIRSL